MRTSSVMKSIFNLFAISILLLVLIPGAYAKKGGGGGGKPGGDPPEVCNDVFPGFVYLKEATKKSPAAIYLASSDGCQQPAYVVTPAGVHSGPVMHVTEKNEVIPDGYSGVVLWTTVDPDNDLHFLVKKVDITIDKNGGLESSDPITILPLPGEGAPANETLIYTADDVWGDDDHSSLYLVVRRVHKVNSVTPATKETLIYDLNDLEKSIVLTVDEECPSTTASYPQFIPACYGVAGVNNWSSSGARLYWSATTDARWYGAVRVDIDKGNNLSLENWIFSEPELVYTGPSDPSADFTAPSGVMVRPPSSAPGEFLAMTYLDRTGRNTVGAAAVLNVDECVGFYAPFSDGNSPAPDDHLWRGCIEGAPFVGGNQGRQNSWQSSDDLLISRLRNSRATDIYRIHKPGQPDMSEDLLIEGAERADSGL